MKYVTSTHKKVEGCIFCAKLAEGRERDRENFVLFRGQTSFVVMNIYPYNTGHLMVLPFAHVSALSELPNEAQFEIMTLTVYFTELLSQLMKADGFNIGMNIGRAAGAGIDSHLHMC